MTLASPFRLTAVLVGLVACTGGAAAQTPPLAGTLTPAERQIIDVPSDSVIQDGVLVPDGDGQFHFSPRGKVAPQIGDAKFLLWGLKLPAYSLNCLSARVIVPCRAIALGMLHAIVPAQGSRWSITRAEDRTSRLRGTFATEGGESRDLGLLLVEAGWMLDDPAVSNGLYRDAQEEAETQKRGVWGMLAVKRN
jgi:hypothetical protein